MHPFSAQNYIFSHFLTFLAKKRVFMCFFAGFGLETLKCTLIHSESCKKAQFKGKFELNDTDCGKLS